MTQILAMHGWAGHAGQWNNWQYQLEQHHRHMLIGERGYTNAAPTVPHWDSKPGPRVVIAHSLGLHLLPASLLNEATALILLGCFAAFVPKGRAGRSVLAGLKGMRAALGSEGELAMLRRFLEKTAQPLPLSSCPPSPLLHGISLEGRQRLRNDLSLLETCHNLPKGWPEKAHVLVIRGEQDAVVQASIHKQLLDQIGLQVEMVHNDPHVGHALITSGVLSVVYKWIEHL
ncbi:alpha/beta hydrolase [Synechococcus sp. M16CYN]|uniref:alpha/beta hydrolase n=1 Tax=Synechococcus sp. M16CYN TaxID=3103139 RepID=UPI00325564B9